MNGGRTRSQGQAVPHGVQILNARGCATMTGAGCGISRRCCELRKTNGLPWRQSGSPTLHGRKSRNTSERHAAALSRGSQLNDCRMPASLDSRLVARTHGMDASELDYGRSRGDYQSSGCCSNPCRKSQPGRVVTALPAGVLDGRLHMRQEYKGQKQLGRVWTSTDREPRILRDRLRKAGQAR